MYEELLRQAQAAEFRGDELYDRGRADEADAAWQAAQELYDRAERVGPARPASAAN